MSEVYQTYLDVIEDVENSRLNEDMKATEKEKALEARKKSLGPNYWKFPPWKK